MAEQYANSLANPTTKLAAGISSADLSLTVVSAAELPSSGNFRLRIDDEIIIVGARSGTTCSSLTRGAESTTAVEHAANASVRLVLTKAGFLAAVDELIHDTAETFTAAQTFSAVTTFSAAIRAANGSAAAPAYSYTSDTDVGWYRSGTNEQRAACNGIDQLRINATATVVLGNLVASYNMVNGMIVTGASLAVTGNTPSEIIIDTANAVVTLPSTSWAFTTTPSFYFLDPSGLTTAGPCQLVPFDDGLGSFADINGTTAVPYWSDSSIPAQGAGGTYAPLGTNFGIWRCTRSKIDTGTGASGGYNLARMATLGV